MDKSKLERIQQSLREAEAQVQKYALGTVRRNDWEREVQRLKNILCKLGAEIN